jgi:hypothetical protein
MCVCVRICVYMCASAYVCMCVCMCEESGTFRRSAVCGGGQPRSIKEGKSVPSAASKHPLKSSRNELPPKTVNNAPYWCQTDSQDRPRKPPGAPKTRPRSLLRASEDESKGSSGAPEEPRERQKAFFKNRSEPTPLPGSAPLGFGAFSWKNRAGASGLLGSAT